MTWYTLFEPTRLNELIENHENQRKGGSAEQDYVPVAKLFVPWGAATWLLTECDKDGLAFGLCDMGFGTPELGYVSMDEVYAITGPGGLKIEQDIHWRGDKPLSEYAEEARAKGRITA